MKKALLSLFLFSTTISFSAFAQQQLPVIEAPKGYIPAEIVHLPKKISSRPLSKKSDAPIQVAYSFTDSARNYTNFIGFNNSYLFPDTTVKQIYGDGSGGQILGNVNIHSIGQVFDVESWFLEDHTPSKTGYRLDSVSLIYGYVQGIPGLADTLVFQFYTSGGNAGIKKGTHSGNNKTA